MNERQGVARTSDAKVVRNASSHRIPAYCAVAENVIGDETLRDLSMVRTS